MTDARLRAAIASLALAGAGIAAYLTYAWYAEATIACATGGCETVQTSEYARVLGVPVPVLGLAGYLALLATAFVPGDNGRTAGAALALGGLAFSAYLLLVQVVAIGAFCVWCLASDAVMAAIALAAVARLRLVPAHS
ncbi:MAG TPA: vitamin K epoxide reductase family protein [Gaiellaceae bacterium]|nr:vitamin K epoxide reductase family protein [Gaiellaceae bacterium]HXV96135.1 vitamin K epoxide reductase family protein [Gaiellaceae bacterium]